MPNYDTKVYETKSFGDMLLEAQRLMNEVATLLDKEGRFGKYGTVQFDIGPEFRVEIKRRGSDSRLGVEK